MAAAREQQLERRIGDLESTLAALESTVAQLIRSTLTAVEHLGGNAGFATRASNGWLTWQQLGAGHQALNELAAHLQRHPAPKQVLPDRKG
jgi:hypothetical protein